MKSLFSYRPPAALGYEKPGTLSAAPSYIKTVLSSLISLSHPCKPCSTTAHSHLQILLKPVYSPMKVILPCCCYKPTGPCALVFDTLLRIFTTRGVCHYVIKKTRRTFIPQTFVTSIASSHLSCSNHSMLPSPKFSHCTDRFFQHIVVIFPHALQINPLTSPCTTATTPENTPKSHAVGA